MQQLHWALVKVNFSLVNFSHYRMQIVFFIYERHVVVNETCFVVSESKFTTKEIRFDDTEIHYLTGEHKFNLS